MNKQVLARLAEELMLGCRILAEQDIVDAYGHLSARVPDSDGLFMINRWISPALAMAEDFLVCDLAGKVVQGDGQPNSEWPIHACTYRARPDVTSVLHSHSRLSRIFSLSDHKLRGLLTSSGPEWQEGLPLYRQAGLVTSVERGDDLARVLGQGSAALLRGHGDLIATGSIKRTVLKAITLKQNADVLQEVLAQGGQIELWSAEELAAWGEIPLAARAPAAGDGAAARAWDYYTARVDGRLARLLGRL